MIIPAPYPSSPPPSYIVPAPPPTYPMALPPQPSCPAVCGTVCMGPCPVACCTKLIPATRRVYISPTGVPPPPYYSQQPQGYFQPQQQPWPTSCPVVCRTKCIGSCPIHCCQSSVLDNLRRLANARDHHVKKSETPSTPGSQGYHHGPPLLEATVTTPSSCPAICSRHCTKICTQECCSERSVGI